MYISTRCEIIPCHEIIYLSECVLFRLSMVQSRSRKLWTWTQTCIGPEHEHFFQNFTNFYEFKLIFSLPFNHICHTLYITVMVIRHATLFSPTSQPPKLPTSNNPGDKNHLVTFFFSLIFLKLYTSQGSRQFLSPHVCFFFFFLFSFFQKNFYTNVNFLIK